MSIPQIQIRQQNAQIGITAQLGEQHLKQPRASVKLKQVDAELQISKSNSRLDINQDKAWDALGLANNLEVMSRIYSQAKQTALQGLARRAQDGERLGDIAHSKGVNPIPSMAKDWRETNMTFNIAGPASGLNVDINYIPSDLSINASPGSLDVQAQVMPPINEYTRGKFDVYWLQRPNVDITPPRIDRMV